MLLQKICSNVRTDSCLMLQEGCELYLFLFFSFVFFFFFVVTWSNRKLSWIWIFTGFVQAKASKFRFRWEWNYRRNISNIVSTHRFHRSRIFDKCIDDSFSLGNFPIVNLKKRGEPRKPKVFLHSLGFDMSNLLPLSQFLLFSFTRLSHL